MNLSFAFSLFKAPLWNAKRFCLLALFFSSLSLAENFNKTRSSLSPSLETNKKFLEVATKDRQKIAENLVYFPALSRYLFGISAVHSGRFQLYELSGRVVQKKIGSELACMAYSRMVYIIKSNMYSVELSERLSSWSCQQKLLPSDMIKVSKLK